MQSEQPPSYAAAVRAWEAFQPTLDAFSAWYSTLSPELRAVIEGRPVNRRRIMRMQKMRTYQHLQRAKMKR